MKKKDDGKTTTRLKEYLIESNLKDEKKFSRLDNIEEYLNFTASEAAVITKVRTLRVLPKQQYYPSFIKEFHDNELTQFICDLVKYGNENISWEKIVNANEEGKKYREKEIERRERSKLRMIEKQIKDLEDAKEKLKGDLNL